MEFGLIARGVAGIAAILGLAYLLSTDRRAVRPRIVAVGLGLQVLFALIVLRTDAGRAFFAGVGAGFNRLLEFASAGTTFILNGLGTPAGAAGYVFAFHTLTTIIFFASLLSVLYHLGVMQLIVKGVAFVMQRTLKTSGAETLSAAANIFVGQTEAPLLVKPFIAKMTRSEIMAIMTGGFATVAGGVMAAYVGMLSGSYPGIAGHLLAASVMAAPAGLMMAKLLVPEVEKSETANTLDIKVDRTSVNVIDAAAAGATDGVTLVLNVSGMLLAFVALVALIDFLLGWSSGALFGALGWSAWGGLLQPSLDLATVLKYAFAPLAWLIGIESGDVLDVGGLLGKKMVLTEFIAFQELGTMREQLSPRSFTMASYALCGFANLASIAIQIGGIGAMAPSRRSDLARLGMKAMLAGFVTTCLTAAIAGMLI